MPRNTDIHVGNKIRQRRRAIGLTQQQLAEKIGVKFQQVQKYETGANRVSASRLVDAAEALQVAPSFFFEGLVQPENPATPATREEISLLNFFRSSVPSAREALLRIAAETAQPSA